MIEKNDFIKTPLNYTGNKSRILSQMLPLFPNNINRFVDLFCGGATVGLNVLSRSKEVVCLDINESVIHLLQTLQLFSESNLILKIEEIIEKFNLSDTYNKGYDIYRKDIDGNNGLKSINKKGYLELREFFNTNKLDSNTKSIYLFVLICFCFNNDIRFNSMGKFNMPIGKTDFNKSLREKLHSFKTQIKNKNIKFYFADFSVVTEFELSPKDFVYADPPYLLTSAVYNNANSPQNNYWDENQEEKLLKTLTILHNNGVKFALSNILSKGNVENKMLSSWIKKHDFKINDINYHYRGASYHKKNREQKEREIIITNYNV